MVSEAVGLLKELITIPSISREEAKAADKLEAFMIEKGLTTHREGNNIWSMHEPFDNNKPTLLLNAHIDTVKPASSWQHDPFTPAIEDDKLFGLGSNDCGGGLVSLLQAFRILKDLNSPYNLVYLASAEEED